MISEDDLSGRLSRFECQRCTACCRQPGNVYLNSQEADRIAAFLGITDREFRDQFCDLEDRRKLILKKQADDACVFLNADGCRVHDVKPVQCVDFPVKWHTPKSLEYCEGIKKLFE